MPYPSDGFYDFVQANKSVDFQSKLFDIVNSSKNNDREDYSYSIGMWDYQLILDNLVGSSVTYSYKKVSDFGINAKPTDTNVKNEFNQYVKSKLDLNIPVMLHITDYDEITGDYNNYHSVVAYYYDDDGIHCNFGWGESSTNTILPSYYEITEAGVADFSSLGHVHSNNYLINDDQYCGCNVISHHHNYDWVYYNSSSHIKSCSCGKRTSVTEAHRISYKDATDGNYTAKCLGCRKNLDMRYDMALVEPPLFALGSQNMITFNELMTQKSNIFPENEIYQSVVNQIKVV